MSINSEYSRPIPSWRFWVPLLFQTALIITVPTQAIYTTVTGKTVILQTAPVDPYELLRGYSQTLRYDISNQDNLRNLPGWQKLPKEQPNGNKVTFIKPGTRFYVILEAPDSSNSTKLPIPWKPVGLSAKFPSRLPANQIPLKGVANYGSIEYGLETYYMPEDQREQINEELNSARQENSNRPISPPPIVMEIKVDAQGNALPIGIWALVSKDSQQQIRKYRF
ncbi:GDYXXLXY domain-containing protein [Moorena sp. SIO4G3]|uniref:GDYXXLXY domain-containing protein n=1 Tax=Moorena sp. SIO4G3 TaxID=2607821 RepID=UPI0014295CED|nr:GDYXXLXY domain-containing protein [Moorena sp. SIO4G3]NEO78243.1 GDYXXLXY domain-containing protein [Moorena sp. SIO4G3]